MTYIYLAACSTERGQYNLLAQMRYTNHLFSYEYKQIAQEFEKVWIYLAGTGTDKIAEKRYFKSYLIDEDFNQLLASYEYVKKKPGFDSWRENFDNRAKVLIDSGAFTAWKSGRPINLKDYAQWALNYQKNWKDKLRSLYFFNLDVIGNQEASNRNFLKLLEIGLNVLPIFTYGADIKHLKSLLEEYDYIGLGGLVGRKDKDLFKWLDYCYSAIFKYKKRTGILRKMHLLGVTKKHILIRYPAYSSDSSTWTQCLRFGNSTAVKGKKIPKYTHSENAKNITLYALRDAINKYKKMEKEVTLIWKQRGIDFND